MPPAITASERKNRQSRVVNKSTDGIKLPKLPEKAADRKPAVVQKKGPKQELKVPKLKDQSISSRIVPCPPVKGATSLLKQASALKRTTALKPPKTAAINAKPKGRDRTPKGKESGRGRSKEPASTKPKKQPSNDSKRGKSKEVESSTSAKPAKQPAKTTKPVVEAKTSAKPAKQPAKTAKSVVEAKTSTKPAKQPAKTVKPVVEAKTSAKPAKQPAKTAKPVVEAKTSAKPAKQPAKTVKPVVEAKTSAKPAKQPAKTVKPVVEAKTSAKPAKQPAKPAKAVPEAEPKKRQKTDKSPAKAIKKGKAETKLVNKVALQTSSKGITRKSPSHSTSRGLLDPPRPLAGKFVHPVAKGLDPILSENESLSSVSIDIDTPPPRRIAPAPVKSDPFNGRVSSRTPQYHTMSVLGVRQEMSPARSIASATPTEPRTTPVSRYFRGNSSVTPARSIASEISSYSTRDQAIALTPLPTSTPVGTRPRGPKREISLQHERKSEEFKPLAQRIVTPGPSGGTHNFLEVDNRSTSPTNVVPTNEQRMEYGASAMEMRSTQQQVASQQGNQKITRRIRPMGARIRPSEPSVARKLTALPEKDGRVSSGRSTAVSSVAGSLWNYSEVSRSKDSRSICSSMAGYTPFSSEAVTPSSTDEISSRANTPNSTTSSTTFTSSTLTGRKSSSGRSYSSVSTLLDDGEQK